MVKGHQFVATIYMIELTFTKDLSSSSTELRGSHYSLRPLRIFAPDRVMRGGRAIVRVVIWQETLVHDVEGWWYQVMSSEVNDSFTSTEKKSLQL
jgi:hypothetical protein